MTINISDTLKSLERSATLEINEEVKKKRKEGKNVLHMGFGEAPFEVHPHIKKALIDNAHRKSYLPTQGLPELREAISGFYERKFGLHYDPSQIIVGPGSKELIFDSLLTIKGDLILPVPSWVTYGPQAKVMGKNVTRIPTKYEDGYLITKAGLEEVMERLPASKKAQQGILLINSPCNPTGTTFSKNRLKEIADFARENKIIVISDEIYGLITFDGIEHHSIAHEYPEGTIVTGGLSKHQSLGGYRLGVALIPQGEKEFLEKMLSVGSETWSCASAPIQYAAIVAYSENQSNEKFIKDCTGVHEIVTKYVYSRFVEIGIKCPEPVGAFYLFPDFKPFAEKLEKANVSTDEGLCKDLLEKVSVAMLPGTDFGMSKEELFTRIATVDYDGKIALDTYLESKDKWKKDRETFVETACPNVIAACNQIEKYLNQLS